MKLTQEQYEEIVEKYAGEVLGDIMEKTAGIKEHITGDRDFSDEKDQKTKFMKDRIAPALEMGVPGYVAGQLLSKPDVQQRTKNIGKHGLKGMFIPTPAGVAGSLASVGGGVAINNARGKRMAEQNGTDWKKGDVAKSTFLAPFATPESIVKKKMRNAPSQEEVVEKAAELLIEAVMVKEACIANAEHAGLYAEASERALNSIGYSMLEK